MGSVRCTLVSCVSLSLLMLLAAVIPPVAGDGMPAYRIADIDDPEDPVLFSSTFESRQLARVDLVNSTHERIRLFLSVYSLDPGKNLTIMVPLRTLPGDVRGEPMKESDFREEYLLDRIETEVVEQDPDEAGAKLWDESSKALQMAFGSMLLTLPGEYSRQRFRIIDSYGKGEDAGTMGGGTTVKEDPEPVQHYEFDGFSIDVYGVDEGGVLDDYLEREGLMIPESDALDGYRGQYVAVIEAESMPPIDAIDYELLQTAAPNTTEMLVAQLRYNPKLDEEQIWDLKYSLERSMRDELEMSGYGWGNGGDPYAYEWELEQIIDDLVDAVFGSTDYEGEVLTVDLPLDDGKVFFPLGTSAGWPNEVGDIDILFSVPDDKDLDIDKAGDAFHQGRHFYLFQMEMANPGFDLESQVREGSEERRAEAERAEWTYDNSTELGYLFAAAALLVLWFGFAFMLRRTYEIEGRWLRNPVLWGMLGLSVLISVPGALLVYLFIDPVRRSELTKRLATMTPIAMYPAAVVMLVLGVVL